MRVLSIATHPDDETLGCGGALLKHAAAGDEIHWILITAALGPAWDDAYRGRQREQVGAVERAFPFDSLTWLKLPAAALETLPLNQVVTALQGPVAELQPDVVYVPNRSDAHSDHRVAFAASMAVLKPFHLADRGVSRVLACETPSETDAAPALAENAFVPNSFVDIGATLARKLEIFELYATEIHPGPGPRTRSSVEALARHRGSTIAAEYAEAFMLLIERS